MGEASKPAEPNPLRAFFISLVLSCLGLALLLVGDRGSAAWQQSRQELQALSRQELQLKAENAALATRVEDAEGSKFELEKNARENLGLVKPDDVVFILPAPAK